MNAKIEISPAVLEWIEANIPDDSIPEELYSKLQAWKIGESLPTFNQLEKISKTLSIPFGYFFLKKPPVEDTSLIECRTIDSIGFEKPSRDLIDVIHDMKMVQDWMKDHLISEDAPKLNFVGSQKAQKNILIQAQYIRELLKLLPDWSKKSRSAENSFNILRNALSNAGIIVMMNGIVGNNTHRSLKIDEFRAFTLIDEYAPLIFINANDSVNGRLFSLLHEFAHICAGVNNLYNDRYCENTKVKKIESVCNAVSAELLVPVDLFVEEWKKIAGDLDPESAISSVAKTFRCGETVIARRALDKKYIDNKTYSEISRNAVNRYNDIRKIRKEKGEGGGNYYRTMMSRLDNRFLTMLISSVQSGSTLYSDAFRLTNTNRSTFRGLAEMAGGVPV